MELNFKKGHNLPLEYLKTLGLTVEYMEHTMSQIPSLFIETVKRIQFMPFDKESNGLFIAYNGGKSSRLLKYIVDRALNSFEGSTMPIEAYEGSIITPCVYITHPDGADRDGSRLFMPFVNHPVVILPAYAMHYRETKCTVRIDATRRDKVHIGSERKTIRAHGKYMPLEDMPLYAWDGEDDLDCVYPLFDWTDHQVLAALFLYKLEFPK